MLWRKISLTLAVGAMLVAMLLPLSASAVSTSTHFLTMYVDRQDAELDSAPLELDTPPVETDGKVYVPLKFIGEALGFPVKWNEQTKRVETDSPGFHIEIDIAGKQVYINKVAAPFDGMALMQGDTLMVKLGWTGDYMGAKYSYNPDQKRVDIIYVKRPEGVYNSETNSSKPVAKFTFGKTSYRIGEPVKYIDLSYDPDAEGIADWKWTGREEAFFKPGKYAVTLQVTDGKGLVSDKYTREITITGETYLDAFNYPLYEAEPGAFIPTDWSTIWAHFHDLPELAKKVTYETDRKLLVSDSPESIKEKGILYSDVVRGKARLYAHHMNETPEKIQFAIMVSNPGTKPVTVRTTNRGEVYPSIYANLIGHEASVDFMLHDPLDEKLVVPPKQTVVYVQMPDFYPGQGVNAFYDLETDGAVQFSFLAMDPIATPISTGFYKELDYVANVRGTFDAADVRWDIDASSFTKPSRLIIGDGQSDAFVEGYDPQRGQSVKNEGNYGVMYKIHADHPRKMVILVLPRGGPFKGPFKINDDFQMVPRSGLMPAFKGVQVLARTSGTEDSLDIEFTPPAGSAFPVDLIFYPLD